ncbi:Alpha/Beta hydrolase protein [Blakeslea trispora]|nr:Alpha/Beta hydrolase protein [Blakeslea trispora]
MSSLQKEMFKKPKLPVLGELPENTEAGNNFSQPKTRHRRGPAYTPYAWNDYFDESIDVPIPNTSNIFRIYRTLPKQTNGPLFVMHHGAGSSALTFGFVAKQIKQLTQGECGVMAFDCRGHGATKTTHTDLSLKTLSSDLIQVIQATVPVSQDIVLIGHSMGGSVVVDVAHQRVLTNALGVAVLDVVEGSAMQDLASMKRILSSRPKSFESIEQAIAWSMQSNTVRYLESARLSIPALLSPVGTQWHWITDLESTEPFWTEWFQDLSQKFLSFPTAKLLLLAGTDTLDKPLMIAQMQGKFQLDIFPDSGHFLQEDVPSKTAQCLIEFWKRNRRLVLPPKVPSLF